MLRTQNNKMSASEKEQPVKFCILNPNRGLNCMAIMINDKIVLLDAQGNF